MNPYFMHDFWGGPVGLGWGGLGGDAAAAFAGFFVIVILWSLAWKGLALWHSARNGEKIWFIVLLFVNTMGILEIIYLFGFRKDRTTTPVFSGMKKTISNAPEKKDDASLPVAESSPE